MINLKNIVEKLNYPDISFTVDNNNLTINFWYHFISTSTYAKGNTLIVTMNEQPDILKFEHAEHLIS